MLCTKGVYHLAIFSVLSDPNSPNSCHFWKKKLVFLSVLRNSCVMKHNSSIPFYLKLYRLSTRRVYESTNMERFNPSSQKSEILHFDELLLSKWYKNSAKKIQKSYLSWHWSVMQNLRKNDLWFQIWHRTFSEFSPNHSKVRTFLFDGFFLVKVYTVWAKKKYRGIIFYDTELSYKILINPDLVV